MLSVSANDLLDLPGVGTKRRSQLVEMVVDLAADGVEEPTGSTIVDKPAQPAATPAPPQYAPSPTDPTPEELLAAAHTRRYAPLPAQTSSYDVAPAEPAAPPRKRPQPATVFKWSAGIGVLCFFLFGLCIETFDPDATSFLSGGSRWDFSLAGSPRRSRV